MKKDMNLIIEQSRTHKQKIAFFTAMLACFAVFVFNLTRSPLWYDEAIEYWFSKVANGHTPGWRMYTSMYERICSTYQPPLYNWLMYCWLLIFDSEFGFRLLGALIMTIGCAGIYGIVQSVTNSKRWSVGVTILYALIPRTVYYAQECAEYYLMLCFVIWMLYFFFKCIRSISVSNLVGFYVCACLSVCSQYGAAFVVAGLWIPLTIVTAKKKNRKLNISQITLTFISLFAVALPLYIWFLHPQIQRQHAPLASGHIPSFWKNPFFDFLLAIYKTFYFSWREIAHFRDICNLFCTFCIYSGCHASHFYQKRRRCKGVYAICGGNYNFLSNILFCRHIQVLCQHILWCRIRF